jgi:hypothetical protein
LHQKISKILIQKEELLKEEFDDFFIKIKDVPEKIQ